MIDKIKRIKYSRLSEVEKYLLTIINGLEYVYVEQWDATSEIYRYMKNSAFLKKKFTNLIYVEDKIWFNLINKFGYNDHEVILLLRKLLKNNLGWEDCELRPYEDFYLINKQIEDGSVR